MPVPIRRAPQAPFDAIKHAKRCPLVFRYTASSYPSRRGISGELLIHKIMESELGCRCAMLSYPPLRLPPLSTSIPTTIHSPPPSPPLSSSPPRPSHGARSSVPPETARDRNPRRAGMPRLPCTLIRPGSPRPAPSRPLPTAPPHFSTPLPSCLLPCHP